MFTRRFDAAVKRKNYVEASQKFTHVFDLHYAPERDVYSRLDRHGDAEDMIRIIKVTSDDEMGRGRFVTFDRRLLDEYMLVTGTSLIRLFDFTRTSRNFNGWSDSRVEQAISRGGLHARLTIDCGQGSYMRGFQIIRTGARAESIRRRMWGIDEEMEF